MPSVPKTLFTGVALGFLMGGFVFYAMLNVNQNLTSFIRQLPVRDVLATRMTTMPPNVLLNVSSLVLPPGLALIKTVPIVVTADMSPSNAEKAFYKYVERKDIECQQQVRLGHDTDGGWNMCIVPPFAPTKPCLVYSFGINNDWSFDDAASTRYGCQVKAFDPSMKATDHLHSARVMFYQTGIGGTDRVNPRKWKLRTLKTLVNELGDLQKIIDYLKMDVEYSEWEAFPSILSSGVLKHVRQFGFEIHTLEVNGRQVTSSALYAQYYNALAALEKQGFRKWYSHLNHFGKFLSPRTHWKRSCCYELVYVNMNFFQAGYTTS